MQENLRTIEQSVMRIDRIVLDLMDTVSIEQGRLALSLVPSDLSGLFVFCKKRLLQSSKPKEQSAGPYDTIRTPGNLC